MRNWLHHKGLGKLTDLAKEVTIIDDIVSNKVGWDVVLESIIIKCFRQFDISEHMAQQQGQEPLYVSLPLAPVHLMTLMFTSKTCSWFTEMNTWPMRMNSLLNSCPGCPVGRPARLMKT